MRKKVSIYLDRLLGETGPTIRLFNDWKPVPALVEDVRRHRKYWTLYI